MISRLVSTFSRWFIGAALVFYVSVASAQRVACVGDSITEGFNARSYPEFLNADFHGAWDIQNYGRAGATVNRSGDVPYDVTDQYWSSLGSGANKVVIMLGTNDGKVQNWRGRAHFETELRHLINVYADRMVGAELYLVTPIPVLADGFFGISDSIVNNEIVPTVRAVAGFRGTQLIDLNQQFLNGEDLYVDPVHPNDAGANRIASIIGNAISGDGSTTTPSPAAKTKLEAQSESLGGGWWRLAGFGDYYAERSPWIFHEDMGWMWDSTDDPDDMVLWSEGAGWIWTSRDVYPNYYSFDEEGWFLLLEDEDKDAYFAYSFETERWGRSPF